jgi:tetratricopeptide (TPR) repeat protein
VIDREVRRFEPAVSHPPQHRPDLPDRTAAWAWLTAEYSTLLALCETSRDWQLAAVLRAYFERAGQFGDWRRTHERALGNVRDSDHLGTAILRHSLGSVEGWSGRPEEAIAHFHEALTASRGDPRLAGGTLNSLGMVLHLAGRDREAEGFLREALAIDARSPRLTALTLGNLGLVSARLGRRDAALDLHREAIALAQECGAPLVECAAELGLGETLLRIGEPDPRPFEYALTRARAHEFGIQEAIALDGLAHVTGEPEHWWQALGIFARLGVAQAELVRAHLADPAGTHCDLCRAPSPVNSARLGSASGR